MGHLFQEIFVGKNFSEFMESKSQISLSIELFVE